MAVREKDGSAGLRRSARDDLAVELRGVTKRYPYRVGLKSFLGRGDEEAEAPGFLALRGIDLEVRAGDRLGIVGRNGAGKSTLLKLVAGRSAVTSGELRVNGEVHALMELGVGFHPEFSGRVNIVSSLVHYGLAGEALEQAVEEVVDFVELGEHLDQPVRTYSRGMKTRVLFAAATALRPEILLIDEVLGAGDPYFTAKAADRVNALVDSGCTLLLVSHSPQQMLQFCDRVLWLADGQVVDDGDAVEVLNAYEAYLEHASERIFSPAPSAGDAGDDGGAATTLVKLSDGREVHAFPGLEGVKIRRVALNGAAPDEVTIRTGDTARLEFDLVGEVAGEFAVRYIVTFWRSDGRRVARAENESDRFRLAEGEVRTIRLALGEMLLGPGDYTISFAVYDLRKTDSTAAGRAVRYDYLSRAIRFTVERAGASEAPSPVAVLPAVWRHTEPA